MAFDFAKNLTNIGNSFMQMGIGYGISKEAMRGGSYGGCGGGSIWGGGYGYGGGMGMGGYGMGGYGGGMGMGMGMGMDYGPDPRLLAMGTMRAAEEGAMAARYTMEQIKAKYRTPDAEAVTDNTDKTAGAKLERGINDNITMSILSEDWKALNTKEERTGKEQEQLENDYRTTVTSIAKSFVAHLQAEGDGQITEEKYVEYFKAHYQTAGMNDDEIATIEQAAYNEFANLDLNDSGAIDYKEIGAYINVMDKDKKGKIDGVLEKDDVQAVGEESVKADNSSFRTKLKESYQNLFGRSQQGGYTSPFRNGY